MPRFENMASYSILTLHVVQHKQLVRRAYPISQYTKYHSPFLHPDNTQTTLIMLIPPIWLVASLLWRHGRVDYNSTEGSGVLLQSEYSGVSASAS